MESAPPPMLTDYRRNYEGLLLGGTRIWESCRFDANNGDIMHRFFLATRPLRSIEGEWWTLQHMHSYVRKNGMVIMTIDLGDLTQRALGYSYGDARIFHPVVNQALGLQYNDRVKSQCWRFYPGYCLVLLGAYLRRTNYRHWPIPKFWVRHRCNKKWHLGTISKARVFLEKAASFCSERDLQLQAAIILPDRVSGKQLQYISGFCQRELDGIEHTLYRNPSELAHSLQFILKTFTK